MDNWEIVETTNEDEEFVKRSMDFVPSKATKRPVGEFYLRWAVEDLANAGPDATAELAELDKAAIRALRDRSSPERVAGIMGITAAEVVERYAAAAENLGAATRAG